MILRYKLHFNDDQIALAILKYGKCVKIDGKEQLIDILKDLVERQLILKRKATLGHDYKCTFIQFNSALPILYTGIPVAVFLLYPSNTMDILVNNTLYEIFETIPLCDDLKDLDSLFTIMFKG